MDELLNRLKIDPGAGREAILSKLEQKQMVYLDRLDGTDDENRRAEISALLDEIEGAIDFYSQNNAYQNTSSGSRSSYAAQSDGGSAEAELVMAWKLYRGEGLLQPDTYGAADHFLNAANMGNAEAQAMLGTYYENGERVDRDIARAEQLYRQSADQGNELGQLFLGSMYQNRIEGQGNYHRRYQAGSGEFNSTDVLAGIREQERYTEEYDKNSAYAEKYLRLAAAQGNEEAKKRLDFWDPEYLLSKNMIERASELGDGDINYRIYQQTGEYRYLKRAAEKGHGEANAELPAAKKRQDAENRSRKVRRGVNGFFDTLFFFGQVFLGCLFIFGLPAGAIAQFIFDQRMGVTLLVVIGTALLASIIALIRNIFF